MNNYELLILNKQNSVHISNKMIVFDRLMDVYHK